ncbi:MAG: cache domain-containing protein [Spirochaetales bacterium]|nr:cache domain-containing protein [Spirochaetales bacterium]
MISEKSVEGKSVKLKKHHILKLIVWVPVLSIFITALIISVLFLNSYHRFLDIETKQLRERLLEDGRQHIKEKIDEIFDYLEFNKVNSEIWLTKELKSRIDIAYSIIESIYDYNKGTKSNEEIIDIVRETLRDVRFFEGRGYYFIHRNDPKSNDYTILQPNLPQLEGDFQSDYKDLNGKVISESVFDLLKSDGEGFLTFYFYLNDQNKKEKKLAYMKLFRPLNIFVGTGEYLLYYEAQLKDDVLKWLSHYRFGDDGYIFVFDKSGIVKMHPQSPDLVGTNVKDIKDSTGYELGREYLKTPGSENGVYVQYQWLNPGSQTEVLKIGYAKYYPEWEWSIGTGIYMDSLEAMVLERQQDMTSRVRMVIVRTIITIGILILAVFIGTLFFARVTSSLFSRYDQYIREASLEMEKLNLSLEEKVKSKNRQLANKNKELEKLVITDSLSNIFNRRYFDFILKKEWYRHMRNQINLSLLMCDVDFFKQYNDTYGHKKGDDCIRSIGEIIKEVCQRPIDIPVRYGGEEFALILPQTDTEGALQIGKEIQNKLEALNIEHIGSDIGSFLTISIGISSIVPEKGHDYSEIIGFADAALYRAKAKGRNRIET